MNADDLMRALQPLSVPMVAAWIRRQREHYRRDPRARRLDDRVRRALLPWFPAGILDRALFVTLNEIRRFNLLERVLASRGAFEAITFQDVIVMPRLAPDADHLSLVFHELVHVVQYEELGLGEFTRRYVGGWVAAGRQYEGIPLERDAYELQDRFVRSPGDPFDARAEVRARLSARD